MNLRYVAGAAVLWIAMPVGYTRAQDNSEREITLVGCVMREPEYRDIYGPGLSGPRGPGIGLRNEYMLVDAREATRGASIPAEAMACPAVGTTFPTAYELTGPNEREIEEYIGRRVELIGIVKEANAKPVGTSGIARPTGGFDPLGHELHLFEVEVGSFREAALAAAPAAAPAERAEAPAPAPEPPAAEPEPEPRAAAEPAPAPEVAVETPPPAPDVAAEAPQPQAPAEEAPQVARAQLPRTASPLPVAALVGFLSLGAAAGLRRIRRRRISSSLLVAVCIVALPGLAAAQQTTTPLAGGTDPFPIESHWLASGSLGSDFEADADDPGVNFAGTMGWLWRGVLGGEFQANFSPDFQLDAAFVPPFLAEEPGINSYMLNVMAAAPLMAGGQFQPYVSGGAGWFTMSADPTAGDENIDLDDTETGWNAGFGLMGFLGQLGVRADLRYFAVGGDEFAGVDGSVLRARHGAVVDDQEGTIDAQLLSGLSFWRGNIGVALRW